VISKVVKKTQIECFMNFSKYNTKQEVKVSKGEQKLKKNKIERGQSEYLKRLGVEGENMGCGK